MERFEFHGEDIRLRLEDTSATEIFGHNLADTVSSGTLIFLRGPLGAGKTTLARGLIQGLGFDGSVKSPTFTIVEPYVTQKGSVFHFDLYRIHDEEELEAMGIRDYLDTAHITLIEWPEKGAALLPSPDLEIELCPDGHGRIASIRCAHDKDNSMMSTLAALIERKSQLSQ